MLIAIKENIYGIIAVLPLTMFSMLIGVDVCNNSLKHRPTVCAVDGMSYVSWQWKAL